MEGTTPMPPGVHIKIAYENGQLKTKLTEPDGLLYSHPNIDNTHTYPLPHIKPIAEDVVEKTRAYSFVQGTILGRAMDMFYASDS
jgi:hypothetical protein